MGRVTLWHFEQKGRAWFWRQTSADGKTIAVSSPHADYGSAASDAIEHGFRPKQQRWEILSHGLITNYEPPREHRSRAPRR
jgi:hypothetical protein